MCVCVCVCMCVCVSYVYSTLIILHTIPVVVYLRLTDPFAIPSIRQLRCLSCYTAITIPHHIRVLDLIYSHLSRMYPHSLTPSGNEQCHHLPICYLSLMTDARSFVARDAEKQAIGSHYR